MNSELDNKLMKRFPFIFADRYASMERTCMCWGFSCGDGWFDLLYLACLGIEEEYRKTYSWYERLYHSLCFHILPKWNRFISKQPEWMCKNMIYTNWGGKKFHRKIKRFYIHMPYWMKASQVKEKFGTLRFYMTSSTPKINEYIDIAEKLSHTTCMTCGKPGKLIPSGWWYTACEEHTDPKDKKEEQKKEIE